MEGPAATSAACVFALSRGAAGLDFARFAADLAFAGSLASADSWGFAALLLDFTGGGAAAVDFRGVAGQDLERTAASLDFAHGAFGLAAFGRGGVELRVFAGLDAGRCCIEGSGAAGPAGSSCRARNSMYRTFKEMHPTTIYIYIHVFIFLTIHAKP